MPESEDKEIEMACEDLRKRGDERVEGGGEMGGEVVSFFNDDKEDWAVRVRMANEKDGKRAVSFDGWGREL